MSPKLFSLASLPPTVVAIPKPKAIMKGTVIGPVVTPPESKDMERKSFFPHSMRIAAKTSPSKTCANRHRYCVYFFRIGNISRCGRSGIYAYRLQTRQGDCQLLSTCSRSFRTYYRICRSLGRTCLEVNGPLATPPESKAIAV